jgi:hypothetical protein
MVAGSNGGCELRPQRSLPDDAGGNCLGGCTSVMHIIAGRFLLLRDPLVLSLLRIARICRCRCTKLLESVLGGARPLPTPLAPPLPTRKWPLLKKTRKRQLTHLNVSDKNMANYL